MHMTEFKGIGFLNLPIFCGKYLLFRTNLRVKTTRFPLRNTIRQVVHIEIEKEHYYLYHINLKKGT